MNVDRIVCTTNNIEVKNNVDINQSKLVDRPKILQINSIPKIMDRITPKIDHAKEYVYTSNTSVNVIVNVSNTSSLSSNNINSSIMVLFSQFKKLNKWFKLLIILLLTPVLFLILIYIVIPIRGEIFKYMNYIVFIVGGLIISYFIMKLYLIEKFKKYNEKPKLYKYIPGFIKKEILNLYEISQLDLVGISFIVNNIVFTLLCVIILFLIYIIIILL